MQRIKLMGALLSAVCAIGLVGAGVAQARDPQWMLNGALLGASETITAAQENPQKLSFSGLTIECVKLKLKVGATITGSTSPKPGLSKETIEYSECTVGGFPHCKIDGAVSGSFSTKPLVDFLAYETQVAALAQNGTGTVTVLEPETGNVIAELTLSEAAPGSGECPLTGVVTLTRAAGQAGVVLKNVEKATEENNVHLLDASATAIKAYWLNEAKDEEGKAGLKLSGVAATWVGKWEKKVKPGNTYSVL